MEEQKSSLEEKLAQELSNDGYSDGDEDDDEWEMSTRSSSAKRKWTAAHGDAERITQLQHQISMISRRIRKGNDALAGLVEEHKALELEARALCINARNKYSTEAIRQDFVDGIMETEAEAEALDEESAFPGSDDHDFEKIAQSLPVYCVSSRGYQSMLGRELEDASIPAYRTPEDTQIPQLQDHAIELGKLSVAQAKEAFLAALSRLVVSVMLWLPSNGLPGQVGTGRMSLKTQEAMSQGLKTLAATLQKDLNSCVKLATDDIMNAVKIRLLEPVQTLCVSAAAQMPAVAVSWGSSSRQGGKVPFKTYKTMCENK